MKQHKQTSETMKEFEMTSKIADNALALYKKGYTFENLVNETKADGLAKKMMYAAWVQFKSMNKIAIKKINDKPVSAFFIPAN